MLLRHDPRQHHLLFGLAFSAPASGVVGVGSPGLILLSVVLVFDFQLPRCILGKNGYY